MEINKTISNFFRKNDIDIRNFKAKDSVIQSLFDINEIAFEYGKYHNYVKKSVCISQIAGFERDKSNEDIRNIFLTLGNFFNKSGDKYRSRSIGMLNYQINNIMEELLPSFDTDPIILKGTGEKKYILLSGFHRYNLLKCFYLQELLKFGKSKNEKAEIDLKYSFNAKISELDENLTYSSYLLSLFSDNQIIIKQDFKADNDRIILTEKAKVNVQGKKEYIEDSEKLIKWINMIIKENDYTKMTEIVDYYNKISSFKKFVDEKVKILSEKYIPEYKEKFMS